MTTHTPAQRASIGTPDDAPHHSTHNYGDRELNTLIKQLRNEVRATRAAQTLAKIETRLRYIQRVMSAHDASRITSIHTLLAAKRYDTARSDTALIWDFDARVDLLRQIHRAIPHDLFTDEATMLNMEMERLVLE